MVSWQLSNKAAGIGTDTHSMEIDILFYLFVSRAPRLTVALVGQSEITRSCGSETQDDMDGIVGRHHYPRF